VKNVGNQRAGTCSGAALGRRVSALAAGLLSRRWHSWFVFLSATVAFLAGNVSAPGQSAVYSWANFVGQPGGYGNADGLSAGARFYNPSGVAVDGAGNVFVADSNNHTIRKITPGGVVTTLAGSAGNAGSDDGTGGAARFNYPAGVAVDNGGNVIVADGNNHTIRRVTQGGVVTTLAGSAGTSGSTDGTGTAALFNLPQSVTVDGSGNIFVADYNNHTIRKITPGSMVTTLAGSAGSFGSTDGTGTAARFRNPAGVSVDGAGNVFVADSRNHTIRKVTSGGDVTTLAGSAGTSGSANGTGAVARFNLPQGVAVDGLGNVFVADSNNHTIRKVTSLGAVTTPAGSAGNAGSADGTGSAARFNYPSSVVVNGAGNVIVADNSNHTIRQMTALGVVTTLAGSASGTGSADGTGTAARFDLPQGVAVDSANNVYVADYVNHTVRKATAAGVVTTLAGSAGSAGSDDGTGGAARFNLPQGVAVDSAGNVYVADSNNHTIRKVTSGGDVTTLAGDAGNAGTADGVGAAAQFNFPSGVAVDGASNVYVADSYNHAIRKITPGGVVTTLAGDAGNAGNADGTGSAAKFDLPQGVAVDGAGNVYVADSNNHTIRKVTATGVVTTLAGSAGNTGSADGTGSAARFNFPSGVAVDGAGNVFTADSGNHTIRRVSTGGVVTTVGGAAGVVGGGDGAGGGARFAIPAGIAMGGNASLYVADSDNNRVSKGTPVDALYAVVYKAQSLGQTNTGAAVLLPLAMEPTPFSFGAYLKQTPNGTVNGVTLELTDSSVQILGPGSPPSNQLDFEYKQSFATKTLMDTAFGNGTYTFSINAAHDGLKSLPVAMAGDSYPSAAPHISNWTDTQALYPATNFTVTWDALPGGATNDFVLFQVREMVSGNPSNYVFQTEVPGAVSALNGTNTSAVIPSGTLAQGRTYLATLLWCKPASTDAATYPGAVGFGMYGIQTMFLLTTTTPAQMITPTNGVTLTRGSTTFTWDSGVGVTQYALWVGSTPASYDLYAAVEPAQSRTLSLPTDGRTLYVRLWSFIAGGWQFNDYVYTAYRTLEISSGSVLPAGIFNIGYNQALQAVGGTGAYTWSWSGSMPPGLGLSAGGLLSGTPTAMGFYNFTIQVDDAFGATTNQNVSMMVRGQDVSYAMAMKEQLFRQTNTGAAVRVHDDGEAGTHGNRYHRHRPVAGHHRARAVGSDTALALQRLELADELPHEDRDGRRRHQRQLHLHDRGDARRHQCPLRKPAPGQLSHQRPAHQQLGRRTGGQRRRCVHADVGFAHGRHEQRLRLGPSHRLQQQQHALRDAGMGPRRSVERHEHLRRHPRRHVHHQPGLPGRNRLVQVWRVGHDQLSGSGRRGRPREGDRLPHAHHRAGAHAQPDQRHGLCPGQHHVQLGRRHWRHTICALGRQHGRQLRSLRARGGHEPHAHARPVRDRPARLPAPLVVDRERLELH